MSVNLIFKIAAVGILVTVLSQVLKHSGREEHAFLTSLAGLIIVLFWIVPYIYELFETMQSLFTFINHRAVTVCWGVKKAWYHKSGDFRCRSGFDGNSAAAKRSRNTVCF